MEICHSIHLKVLADNIILIILNNRVGVYNGTGGEQGY